MKNVNNQSQGQVTYSVGITSLLLSFLKAQTAATRPADTPKLIASVFECVERTPESSKLS